MKTTNLAEPHVNDRRTLLVPILLITVGTGWLLTTVGIAPDINWVWTLGIAICGVATFIACGFDKFSFVVGSFFLVTSLLSVLRQSGKLEFEKIYPLDAEFDTYDDMPQDLRESRRYRDHGDVSISGVAGRLKLFQSRAG